MKLFATLALTLFLTAACSSHSTDDTIAAVEIMINNSDFDAAQKACNNLMSDSANLTLSAKQWAQLSIAHMQLAENNDLEENAAIATKCYRNAFAVDSDSAALYFENIDIDLASLSHTLRMLSSSIDNPIESLEVEDIDSIF